MIKLLSVLTLSLLSVVSCASDFENPPPIVTTQDGVLYWEDPTLREDGSQLQPFEISSYVVGHGMVGLEGPAATTDVGYVNEWSFFGLGVGIHEFAVQTVDSDGQPGNWSNIILVPIEGPSKPGSASGVLFQ